MNTSKGNMILLTVLAVATLLVAVVGATFAYFGATIGGSESQTTIEVTSGTLSIEYDSDSKIHAENLQPGENVVIKEFTVTGLVTGSSNLNYSVVLNATNNTYSEGALVYTLASVNESENGSVIESISKPVAIKTGANKITLGDGLFVGPTSTGAVHKYVLTITFANTGADQSVDLGKVFDGQISISQ